MDRLEERMNSMKKLEIHKRQHNYIIMYDTVQNLINTLVDHADNPKYNLDLMDVFYIVHQLAHKKTEEIPNNYNN